MPVTKRPWVLLALLRLYQNPERYWKCETYLAGQITTNRIWTQAAATGANEAVALRAHHEGGFVQANSNPALHPI